MATSPPPSRDRTASERKIGLAASDPVDEGACHLLEEHERMIPTGADRDAFLDALLNPPEPAETLVAALRRHSEHFG